MPIKRARLLWSGAWYRTSEPWLLLGALVLPLGWMLALCRVVWVRFISRREARAGGFAVMISPGQEFILDDSAPTWRRYSVAVASVVLAWALAAAIPSLRTVAIPVFFAAVTLSTFYGHLGPGLLATALSMAVLDYSFLPPIRDLMGGIGETVRVATFALAATLINSLHERRRLAEAWRRESEARERANLEETARELGRAHETVARALADRENIMESVADILYTLDDSGMLRGWNRRLEHVTHFQPEELRGRLVPEMFEAEDRAAVAAVIRAAADGGHGEQEARLVRKDGTPIPYQFSCVPLRNSQGEVIGLTGVGTDISERKRLEQQLWQLQKMEAVGRLAGGVAHDFGNLLTVIHVRAQLALLRLGEADPARQDIELLDATAARAGGLVKQLLAFSRKQVLQPKVLDLNAAVEDAGQLLRPLIGEDVSLVTTLAHGLGRVKADPIQFEQVLVNLVVNARDAMPKGGGKITVETADVDLDEAFTLEHAGASSGPHVMLRVRDTGTGMDEAIRAQIFEPFFTTKQVGKGTGLGLATVYGIVKQHGGSVTVDSEPGRGSTFSVYLPRVDEEPESEVPVTTAPSAGGETVLLVDDDEELRTLACGVLRLQGYVVLEAATPEAALAICEEYKDPIDLLLTDVVMPVMSGRALAERVRPLRPEAKIMYMSGYPGDVIGKHGVLTSGSFVQKPFTPATLSEKVREVFAE